MFSKLNFLGVARATKTTAVAGVATSAKKTGAVKKFTALTAMALVAFSLSACGGDGGDSQAKKGGKDNVREVILKEFSKIRGEVQKNIRLEFLRTEEYLGDIYQVYERKNTIFFEQPPVNIYRKIHYYNRHDPYKPDPETLSYSEFDIRLNYTPNGAERFRLGVNLPDHCWCYNYKSRLLVKAFVPAFDMKPGDTAKMYVVCSGAWYQQGGFINTTDNFGAIDVLKIGESTPVGFVGYLNVSFDLNK